MVTGFLGYSGGSVAPAQHIAPITAGVGVTITPDPTSGNFPYTISTATTAPTGLTIQATASVQATDVVPSVVVALPTSTFGYNSAAEFATLSLVPDAGNTSSIFYLDLNYQITFITSSTLASGVAIGVYTSNLAGAAPICISHFYYPTVATAPTDPQQSLNGLAVIPNTTGSSQTVYLCAFIVGSAISPLILGASPTTTNQFKGASYSSILMNEVAN